MSKFDKLKVGDTAELRHVISQADVDKFVELSGDDNKLHTNSEYASKTSFKKPVAHGMIGASFISTVIGTKIPGDGALWFAQSLEFLLPVRVGDELLVRVEILKKIDQQKVIELKTEIFNQHKQKVTSGIAKVKVVDQLEEIEMENSKLDSVSRAALVVGGTGGIGKASCIALAKHGYSIVIHYHTNKDAAKLILEDIIKLNVKACIVSGDITSLKDVERIVEEGNRRIGPISLLVNCSTLKIPSIKFEKLEWADFENHIDINVKSNFYLVGALIPIFRSLGYGKFIFLTSQVTENAPPNNWSFYTTAKYALNGFAKSLAIELAPSNIKVNLVSPGMTETELNSDVPERIKLLIAAKTPLRRLANVNDIASAIVFLASPGSDFITGETIRVNGGQTMQ